MVEYHEYHRLNRVLTEISAPGVHDKEIKNQLMPIFRSTKLFYHRSDAIIQFLKSSIDLVNDQELLELIYDKIDLLSFKVKVALKLRSKNKLLSSIQSPFYHTTIDIVRDLLEHPDIVDADMMAVALDNLNHITMMVGIATEAVNVYGLEIFTIIAQMQREYMRDELLEIVIQHRLISLPDIILNLDAVRRFEVVFSRVIPILPHDQLQSEFQREISIYGMDRELVLVAMITCCIDQGNNKLKAEMRLSLPSKFMQYLV